MVYRHLNSKSIRIDFPELDTAKNTSVKEQQINALIPEAHTLFIPLPLLA